ncbi:glutaredoxin family protein [Patescibacteria group bacterium]|nr:glutaredoxin family protein [Patescibacteria group bacterium]MCL5092015.1 glutaredoxin family protein [Patescibacteria group bacterium]
MKITVYTINDCQFSKQEKDYLNANKMAFEEKNLETNKEFLTEMLTLSNNFAGTPVTKIEKDDGQIVVLKGFTKDEFDTALGLTPTAPTQVATAAATVQPLTPPAKPTEPTPPQPTAPEPTTPPPVGPPVSTPEPPRPTMAAPEPTPISPAVNPTNPLNSILSDLETKANPTPTEPTTNPPAGGLPNIPDFGKTN